ncbi:uncharacterized protein PF3D7_1120000-like [Cardiocondyla obscurior]|uniref:uncharacterized protein PF3D7_1120000-like n=1 Tax=Cardiocondyla obscurior TaxID=286306 RepID=UPI0039655AF2
MAKKRKKRQEDKEERIEIEGFRKSSKIGKSPVKGDKGKKKERDGEEGTSKDRFEEVIREVRNGFEKLNKQMKEVKECKTQIKEEMEELKRMWNKEKIALEKKLDKRLKELEKKVNKKGGKGAEDTAEEIGWKMMSLEERVRMMEMGEERKRKEWRKNNIIIRGLKLKEEGKVALREKVEEVFEKIGVKAKIVDVNKIGEVNKGGYSMAWVKLESFKDKVEIMRGKGKLKERTEWIEDDLTEYERKVEWCIKREAEKYKKKGKKVKIGYKKL